MKSIESHSKTEKSRIFLRPYIAVTCTISSVQLVSLNTSNSSFSLVLHEVEIRGFMSVCSERSSYPRCRVSISIFTAQANAECSARIILLDSAALDTSRPFYDRDRVTEHEQSSNSASVNMRDSDSILHKRSALRHR